MNTEESPIRINAQPNEYEYLLVYKHKMRQRGKHPLKLTTKRPLSTRPSEEEMDAIVTEERLSSDDISKNNRTLEELRLISLELKQRRDGKVARAMGAAGIDLFKTLHKIRNPINDRV